MRNLSRRTKTLKLLTSSTLLFLLLHFVCSQTFNERTESDARAARHPENPQFPPHLVINASLKLESGCQACAESIEWTESTPPYFAAWAWTSSDASKDADKVHFRIKKAEARDSGRLQTVPQSHFSMHQHFPSHYASVTQHVKYFLECGRDRKRDARFAPETCVRLNDSSNAVTTVPPEKLEPTAPIKAVNLFVPRPHPQNKPTPVSHNSSKALKALQSLLQAWSLFTQKNKIIWWLAHGQLLGWYWNGNTLPWDTDLDIQMTMFQLIQLIRFNNTLVENRYLVDVNPNFASRKSTTKLNTIDARFIDTHTGYMMDITALVMAFEDSSHSEFTGLLFCKSPHAYNYADIVPLHETVYESIQVWRPHAVAAILTREYGLKSLVKTVYRPYSRPVTFVFQQNQNKWVDTNTIKWKRRPGGRFRGNRGALS
ncbi:hypothetical protein HDU81_009779 [Chytriomyces hyalinus]|nr:hypothetical protein HDU81_009779 [Chytriomyces hyalinus]